MLKSMWFCFFGGAMKGRYGRFLSPIYIMNIIFQAFLSLISPAAVMLFAALLLDKYTEVGGWIYAVLITVGVLMGFISMIKFVLRGMAALEAIEKQNKENSDKKDRI